MVVKTDAVIPNSAKGSGARSRKFSCAASVLITRSLSVLPVTTFRQSAAFPCHWWSECRPGTDVGARWRRDVRWSFRSNREKLPCRKGWRRQPCFRSAATQAIADRLAAIARTKARRIAHGIVAGREQDGAQRIDRHRHQSKEEKEQVDATVDRITGEPGTGDARAHQTEAVEKNILYTSSGKTESL